MIGIGVTGTDTGVGKTVVSCAIAAAFVRRGARVGVMKPVETGVASDATDRDAFLLRGRPVDRPADTIAPVTLPDPLAPMIAARRAGVTIALTRLDVAFDSIAAGSDIMIVEGAGGLLVPIAADVGFDTLFRRWQLPVVVVAANRLGAINHVLLTVAAATHASVKVAAIVLNERVSARMDLAADGNAELLDELLPRIPIVELPWVADPHDWDALALAANACGLIDILARAG